MNILIIGFGSIGARHARILEELGHQVFIVSRRPGIYPRQFLSVPEAIDTQGFDYVIVSNSTTEHFATVRELRARGYSGQVLVEKPLFQPGDHLSDSEAKDIFVAYHLRFDPVLQKLRELTAHEDFVSVEMRAGSYLPEWRPSRNYRETESASKAAGGGVLRDMSHELDFSQWLFGRWTRLTAIGGHFSDLEIDSDDVYTLLAVTERCRALTLTLNYIDRQPEERWIVANTRAHTWRADLVNMTLSRDGQVIFRTPDPLSPATLDDFYRRENQAVLSGRLDSICTYEEGLSVVHLIAAAERAARDGTWIDLKPQGKD